MPNPPIRIERISVGDLPRFARHVLGSVSDDDVVPITVHRALAQQKNPHASPDDVGLVLAWAGDRLVGYIGLVPGRLELDGETVSVYWPSTWFVSPDLRGSGVGYRLLADLITLDHDLFATSFTRAADRVLRSAGFLEFGRISYLALDLGRSAPWAAPLTAARRRIQRRAPEFATSLTLLREADRLARRPPKALIYPLLARSYDEALSRVRWREVGCIDPRTYRALDGAPARNSFLRGPEIIEWMLKHPWVLEASTSTAHRDARYRFSDVRPLFRRIPLELHSPGRGEPAGYMILLISEVNERVELKVLDHAFADENIGKAALGLALRYGSEYRADYLVFSDSLQPLLRGNSAARPFLRECSRPYLARPSDPNGRLARSLGDIRLRYVDGDSALT